MKVILVVLPGHPVMRTARLPCAVSQMMMKVSGRIVLLPHMHVMIYEIGLCLIHNCHLLCLVEVALCHHVVVVVPARLRVVSYRFRAYENFIHISCCILI
jgi:hypothetical protein